MISDVPGVRVGHWTDLEALTGCTVIVPPPNSGGSVFVPGGSPATRGTDGLAPGTAGGEVHAVVLTGGSAFGLAAADGVMAALEERGIGLPLPAGPVPIVPCAAIYDLGIGTSRRPGPAEARAAFEAAQSGPVAEGNVGAGTGATVGKTAGPDAISKGGLGSASVAQDGVVVGAIAVVNAIGDVLDTDGSVIAGARGEPAPLPPVQFGGPLPPPGATTIACVITNAWLTKEHCHRVAIMASAGLARAVSPAFTMLDGDTVFALTTREIPFPVELVGRMAADALAEAVRRGARAAADVPGAPARGTRASGEGGRA